MNNIQKYLKLKEFRRMELKVGKIVKIPKERPLLVYKKLDLNNRSPIHRFKYEKEKVYRNENFDEDSKSRETTRFYSIVPKSLGEVHFPFGLRVYEAYIWGKCILESKSTIGSKFIQIKKELSLREILPYMNSMDAYRYCYSISDTKTVRDKISEDLWLYNYCILIKDRKEVAQRIKSVEYQKYYQEFKEKLR